MSRPEMLTTADGRLIAYRRASSQAVKAPEGRARPGVTFLGGFRSDMDGSKAQHLHAWAQRTGRAFLRFDYTGHGASSGAFEEGCIGDWARDAMDAVAALTEGPQILVGSSMGGWIALLLARAMPERVAALVGIAAAPDFTEDSMWRAFTPAQRATLLEAGRLALPSDYDEAPMAITRRLIEDGRRHLVLRSPLSLPFPVRLLQGTADADVPVETAWRLLAHMDCPDARAILVKDADHRMSDPAALALLTETLEALPV